jgi:hypothetical protein
VLVISCFTHCFRLLVTGYFLEEADILYVNLVSQS